VPGDCECTYPCEDQGFPPGTCIDKHYIDTNARFSTAGQACPAVCRVPGDCECTYPCEDQGFPPGTCIDKHYIDTNARFSTAGQACPAVCRVPGDCECATPTPTPTITPTPVPSVPFAGIIEIINKQLNKNDKIDQLIKDLNENEN
jgi:hypothetical protein